MRSPSRSPIRIRNPAVRQAPGEGEPLRVSEEVQHHEKDICQFSESFNRNFFRLQAGAWSQGKSLGGGSSTAMGPRAIERLGWQHVAHRRAGHVSHQRLRHQHDAR